MASERTLEALMDSEGGACVLHGLGWSRSGLAWSFVRRPPSIVAGVVEYELAA